MSQQISGLSQIAGQYRAILSDVWGVVHNGVSVYEAAADALAAYRNQGGQVVLLTNSPRPCEGVLQQLDEMGVRKDAYDAIVTSGDVTRTLIKQSQGKAFHLGPQRDLPLFTGTGVELVAQDECNTIVCTGLFEDTTETPDDYRDILSDMAQRGIPFICANPDIVVERGDRLIYCAGSLAQLYQEMGGVTLVAGKPHKPIYDLAMQKLSELNSSEISKNHVLAIGDGMPTDVAGALNNGFDLLYISAGIHSAEYGDAEHPDPKALAIFLNEHDADPVAWMPRLGWE